MRATSAARAAATTTVAATPARLCLRWRRLGVRLLRDELDRNALVAEAIFVLLPVAAITVAITVAIAIAIAVAMPSLYRLRQGRTQDVSPGGLQFAHRLASDVRARLAAFDDEHDVLAE